MKKIMKIGITFIVIFAGVASFHGVHAAGCIICTTGSQECYRVVTFDSNGDKVINIHYGESSECPNEQ